MKIEPTAEREYTTAQFAEKVGLKPSRIRQMLGNKEIEGSKPPGSRDWWIPESQVEIVKERRRRWLAGEATP